MVSRIMVMFIIIYLFQKYSTAALLYFLWIYGTEIDGEVRCGILS